MIFSLASEIDRPRFARSRSGVSGQVRGTCRPPCDAADDNLCTDGGRRVGAVRILLKHWSSSRDPEQRGICDRIHQLGAALSGSRGRQHDVLYPLHGREFPDPPKEGSFLILGVLLLGVTVAVAVRRRCGGASGLGFDG